MKTYSGTFILRVEPALHKKLQLAAQKKGSSLNRYCEENLAKSLNSYSGSVSDGVSLKEEFVKAGIPLVGILIFGSFIRGDANESSDTDFLFVTEQGFLIERSLYQKWDDILRDIPYFKSFQLPVSPQFVSLPSSPKECGSLWFEVAIEGKIIWEDGRAISEFLRKLREEMLQGHLIRKISHGHPYWIRKS